ncbi:MAG: MBL fold metallo-hydrolase [Leptospirales bacterium]|nr:MBL fold metallo-hydrolase [Leptospirales bacterium]
MPRVRLLFDIGVGSPRLTEIPRLLLTHGHLDHSAGAPYYVSQRNLRRLPPADIWMPPEMEPPLRKILELWAQIEDYQPVYNLHAVDYQRIYPLNSNLGFQGLRSFHRVPSNGYAIVEKTIKLRDEFRSLPGTEIARLKKERNDLFYEGLAAHVVFSGDTRIEFVTEHELARRARILFLECTYICEKRPTERARLWGHTHLDEIAAHAECFRDVEQLVLIHFSPRYGREEIQATLQRKLPRWLLEKTLPLLPGPRGSTKSEHRP